MPKPNAANAAFQALPVELDLARRLEATTGPQNESLDPRIYDELAHGLKLRLNKAAGPRRSTYVNRVVQRPLRRRCSRPHRTRGQCRMQRECLLRRRQEPSVPRAGAQQDEDREDQSP